MTCRLQGFTFVLVMVLTPVLRAQATTSVTVQAIMDPFLAGQPNGVTANCGQGSCDTAPAQSPLLVPLTIVAGQTVQFLNATGSVAYGTGLAFFGPDGGFNQSANSSLGISGYTSPICAILGVFMTNGTNSGPAPASLNFSTPASRDFPALSPLLFQTFFIGDGHRNDGVTVQNFVAPPGATRLFLGVTDGCCWYDNLGSFTVSVSPTTQTMFLVPSSPFGAGSLQLQIASGPASGLYFMAATLYGGAYPGGWFYGLDIPFSELGMEIATGSPFIGPLDPGGNSTIGPYSGLAPGLTFYAVALGIPPGSSFPAMHSPPITYTIP